MKGAVDHPLAGFWADSWRVQPVRQTRPRRATPWLWALAGVVVLILLFAFGASANDWGPATKSEAAVPTARPTVSRAPGIGAKVRDGDFEFKVSKVDCGRTTVTNGILKTTADGKFCVVSMTVRNLGDESKLFSSKIQHAYDAAGTKFTDDDLADFYANDNSQTFLKEIAPGRAVGKKIVFDVPAGTDLTVLELHESIFSSGVRVSLE